MSIATDVSRIKGNITAALAEIADKGVTVPAGSNSDALASLIASIEAGAGGEADDTLKEVIERTVATLTLPNNLTIIGNYAFYQCENLAITSLPTGVTRINMYGFNNCSKLALTSLPAGLTYIGNYAFVGCNMLKLTSFPAELTYIGARAFANCYGLKSITFEGTAISKVDSNAFANCPNLRTINVPWAEGKVANAPWGATNATINYNYVAEEE